LSRRQAAGARGEPREPRGRRIALFGGTFDPIHAGHIAVARAAERRFHLDQVIFIPCGRPPHKNAADLLPFAHRFAMVALACSGYPRFAPSLLEAGSGGRGEEIFYSVDTVRRFRRTSCRRGDRLYFLLGADSFLQIATWKDYKTLLSLCDFVIANRPGFRSRMLYEAIAPELLARPQDAAWEGRSRKPTSIALRNSTVYLLDAVSSHVSATAVRKRLGDRRSIRGLVPRGVEDYIKKQALYRNG
jgi:nicotinate-nucleotide adenylyltransferase